MADLQPAVDVAPLRAEIDQLDGEIVRIVRQRVELAVALGRAQVESGGTRTILKDERNLVARYGELGYEGHKLALALLALTRVRVLR